MQILFKNKVKDLIRKLLNLMQEIVLKTPETSVVTTVEIRHGTPRTSITVNTREGQ